MNDVQDGHENSRARREKEREREDYEGEGCHCHVLDELCSDRSYFSFLPPSLSSFFFPPTLFSRYPGLSLRLVQRGRAAA